MFFHVTRRRQSDRKIHVARLKRTMLVRNWQVFEKENYTAKCMVSRYDERTQTLFLSPDLSQICLSPDVTSLMNEKGIWG